MNSGDHEAIRRVVAAFERSDWAEIDVRVGDVRVHLAATGRGPVDPPLGSPPPAANAAAGEPALAVPTHQPPAIPDGAHVVAAPSPGIFWRAPQPGAPPFAEVGDVVEPDTTTCIVEVMKLMSHVKAGVAGRVVAVYGRNGEAVATGDALFAIEPAGA